MLFFYKFINEITVLKMTDERKHKQKIKMLRLLLKQKIFSN